MCGRCRLVARKRREYDNAAARRRTQGRWKGTELRATVWSIERQGYCAYRWRIRCGRRCPDEGWQRRLPWPGQRSSTAIGRRRQWRPMEILNAMRCRRLLRSSDVRPVDKRQRVVCQGLPRWAGAKLAPPWLGWTPGTKGATQHVKRARIEQTEPALFFLLDIFFYLRLPQLPSGLLRSSSSSSSSRPNLFLPLCAVLLSHLYPSVCAWFG